jgi:hypothetical protein
MIILVVLLSGCSTTPDTGPERLAGSLPEYYQKYLDTFELSDFDKEVLNRAIQSGRIATEDYEDAHAHYASCLTSAGFQPSFRKTPAGLYIELPYARVKDQEALDQAHDSCSEPIALIDALYALQQSNPDLLADWSLVAVNCLRAAGVIDETYTVEDFKRDDKAGLTSDAPGFPFDVYEESANNCLWQSGRAYFTIDEE